MKKIRGIRTPNSEPTCRYVCIDDFEEYKPIDNYHSFGDYYCGILVYEDYHQKELAKDSHLRCGHGNFEMGKFDPICRNREDVFEPPTIAMYLTLANALRTSDFVFNKKKGIMMKKEK